MFDTTEYNNLEDHIDKWYPSCTLCNDLDRWINDTLCLCNDGGFDDSDIIIIQHYIATKHIVGIFAHLLPPPKLIIPATQVALSELHEFDVWVKTFQKEVKKHKKDGG